MMKNQLGGEAWYHPHPHLPVWTPMGSTFSMEQTMTTLSFKSRITSSSYSFQPMREISTRTCGRAGHRESEQAGRHSLGCQD